MKKTIISAALVAAIGAGGYMGFRANSSHRNQLSDVMLANIEALAEDETISEKIVCYSGYIWEPLEHFVYCYTCKERSGHHTGKAGECLNSRPIM